MMKLELKHLSVYYPYDLKVQYYDDERGRMTVCDITELRKEECTISNSEYQWEVEFYEFMPILRPMSELFFGKVTESGVTNYCMNILQNEDLYGNAYPVQFTEADKLMKHAQLINKLCEWHFDVFNLIPNRCAIDINTLQP